MTIRRPSRTRLERPRGYAMAMFLLILVVVTMVSYSLATASSSVINNTRTATARAEARLLAMTAVEDFYAAMIADPKGFSTYLGQTRLAAASSCPGNATLQSTFHPALCRYAHLSTSADGSTTFVESTGAGEFTNDSVMLTVTPLGSTTYPRAIRLTADVRAGCAGDVSGSRCVYASFEQRLRRAQFYDFLFYNEYAQLDAATLSSLPASLDADPACAGRLLASTASQQCRGTVPAYRSGGSFIDVVRGPVYLLDDFVPLCGSPEFQRLVLVGGKGVNNNNSGPYWESMAGWRGDSGCGTPAATTTSMIRATTLKLRLPTESQLGVCTTTCATDTPVEAARIEGNLIEIFPSGAGPVTLEFTATDLTVGGSTRGPSARITGYTGKLVYVSGTNEVKVAGVVAGDVTVITTGSVTLPGDLTYASNGANSRDAIGIVAKGQITISEPTAAEAVTPRRLVGVLISLDRSVAVANWWATTNTGTLQFTGTIAGRYRGVFGGYDPTGGTLATGFAKDFAWDGRFTDDNTLLRYLPRPETESWARVDLSEVRTSR